jgi:sulfur-carrier protein
VANVTFAPALQRYIVCKPQDAPGATVREVLDAAFSGNMRARAYVLDDQSALRKHMTVFVNGKRIRDRIHLSDSVTSKDSIYVLQSLSGG